MKMAIIGGNKKFRECLNQTLIPMFEMIFIVAPEGEILNRTGYFAIVGYLVIGIIATINGMLFVEADASLVLIGVSVVTCAMQVSTKTLTTI